MLRHDRLDWRDVLNNLAVFAAGLAQRIVTSGTFCQLVLYKPIYLNRSRTAGARVSILATWLATTLRARRLAVGRSHCRWS
jgi:hypothetical protein